MRVLEVQTHKSDLCRKILEELPNWFGMSAARESYISKSDQQVMFACEIDGKIVGMLTLETHSQSNLEIAVMGVLPDKHRQGVGSALLEAVEIYAKSNHIRILSVKTISDSSVDPFYAKTRNFYSAMGFSVFEELPELWGADNPCCILVKPIVGSTW